MVSRLFWQHRGQASRCISPALAYASKAKPSNTYRDVPTSFVLEVGEVGAVSQWEWFGQVAVVTSGITGLTLLNSMWLVSLTVSEHRDCFELEA